MTHIVLIHPPVALPSEPPAGPVHLAGRLRARGWSVRLVDAGHEALVDLVSAAAEADSADPRIRRLPRAWEALHNRAAYALPARHHAALRGVEHGLAAWVGRGSGVRLGLAEYIDPAHDLFDSASLAAAAATPEGSPFDGWVRRRLLPRLAEWAPRLVGVSIGYRQQVLPAVQLAARVREAFPGMPLVAGGGMVSAWVAAAGGPPAGRLPFDAWVAGDGTAAVEALLRGGTAAEGLHRPGMGATPAAPHRAEDLAAGPAFDDLPLGGYLAPEPILPVASSRGCYWHRCAFCPEARDGRAGGFAALSGEALWDRLEGLRARTGARRFHLVDSAIPPSTLSGLAAAAEHRGPAPFQWYGFARFEPSLADPGFCVALRRAGCRALQLGLETASPRLLERLGKGIGPEQAERALAGLQAGGIAAVVYVLVGLPTEGREDAEATRDFLVRNAERIHLLHASVMNLAKGTPLDRDPGRFDLSEAEARRDFPGDLSVCRDLRTTGAAERRVLRRFLAKEILGHPALRSVVRRLPPVLGANHVLFTPLPAPSRDFASPADWD